ncbi:DUF6702 family protein [Parasediminibacterium sp. JCM 36343]|uniref:DUF6702 family protein n=1 Tax=Parasediminibacterium sp. JCM 36343 TaxID=3374279 RepID=UPI00397908DB
MVNILVRWFSLAMLVLPPSPKGEVETSAQPYLTPALSEGRGGRNQGEGQGDRILMHPFYLSMIEIDHNAKEKTAEISIRIFTEDLEGALRKFSNTKIDLLHPADKAATEKILNAYIQSKFQLTLNEKAVTLHFVGYEQQIESIWTYLEVKDVPIFKKASINCSLLYDYQDKQVNIFHVKANGTEKSNKLDFPKNGVEFEF